jgi:hypothetical protein
MDRVFRAEAYRIGESLLHGYLTIIKRKALLLSLPMRPPRPSARALRQRDGVVESQSLALSPSGSPAPGTLYENDSLLKISRGASC